MNDSDLSSLNSVKAVIESNARFTDGQLGNDDNGAMTMDGLVNRRQIKEICNRPIVSCVASLSIIFKYRPNPLTLSVVGHGGGGPIPLANQPCW